MLGSGQTCLIGVDGGGSRCRLAAADASGRVLARVEAGSANIASDFDVAFGVIAAGLDQVLADMGLAPKGRVYVHLGLAGANAPGTAVRLHGALSLRFPGAELMIEDDQRTAVTAALGGADGAVASCGTGSFICRQVGDDLRSVGGWGLGLGDQASGAWLGQNAMRRAVLGLDGMIPMTNLLRAVADQAGGDCPAMVAFSLRAKPIDYANFTPLVIAHAEAGDPEALRLMTKGAAYLRDALRVLGHAAGQDLCLLGGVGRHYAPYLPDFLCQPPRLPAVSGALILAARAAGIKVEGKPWT